MAACGLTAEDRDKLWNPTLISIGTTFKFIRKCIDSNVDVVQSVANYAVTYGRNNSPLSRNAMFCMDRYNCNWYFVQYENWRCASLFLYLAVFLRFIWVRLICCGYVSWSETKFSNCLTGLCHQMCVRLLTTFLVVSDLFVLLLYYFSFVCIVSILCVFLYFCILCLIFFTVPLVRSWCYWDAVYSVFYFFFFFFIVYLVYDFIIK